jgi:hypothetical protein
VAPLRLGGLRGKKSTPSVWLGGTGEFFVVGKQEQELQERGVIFEAGDKARYAPLFCRVEWLLYRLVVSRVIA